jgi:hypothetical protein
MIILPDCTTLPCDHGIYTSAVYFASTQTGWMTQRCFLIYVHCFLCELTQYQKDLPSHLQGQTMLLIIDGHTSRWTFEAMTALRLAGIDVLVLPAHCTHLLQPYDITVASPVKAALTFYCNELSIDLAKLNELMACLGEPQWLSEKRRILIDAFVNAWNR